MAEPDYYKILGVSMTATASEIKSRYLELSKKIHPDHGGDDSLMALVNEAYTTLSGPASRKQYDGRNNASAKRDTTYEPPKPRPQSSYSNSYQYTNARADDARKQARRSRTQESPPRTPQLSSQDQKRLVAVQGQIKKNESYLQRNPGVWFLFGSVGVVVTWASNLAGIFSQNSSLSSYDLGQAIIWTWLSVIGAWGVAHFSRKSVESVLRRLRNEEAAIRALAR